MLVECGVAGGKGLFALVSAFAALNCVAVAHVSVHRITGGFPSEAMNHLLQALRLSMAPGGFGPKVFSVVEEGEHGFVGRVAGHGWLKVGLNHVWLQFGLSVSAGALGFVLT